MFFSYLFLQLTACPLNCHHDRVGVFEGQSDFRSCVVWAFMLLLWSPKPNMSWVMGQFKNSYCRSQTKDCDVNQYGEARATLCSQPRGWILSASASWSGLFCPQPGWVKPPPWRQPPNLVVDTGRKGCQVQRHSLVKPRWLVRLLK